MNENEWPLRSAHQNSSLSESESNLRVFSLACPSREIKIVIAVNGASRLKIAMFMFPASERCFEISSGASAILEDQKHPLSCGVATIARYLGRNRIHRTESLIFCIFFFTKGGIKLGVAPAGLSEVKGCVALQVSAEASHQITVSNADCYSNR